MNLDFYYRLNSLRQAWEPITPKSIGYVHEGAYNAISRCLCLRYMELDVQDWISHETETVPKDVKQMLLDNMADEDRHDVALNNVAKVFSVSDGIISEAKTLREDWLYAAKTFGYLSITALLERSVFFCSLPFMRMFGDSALKTVANDISNDERIHAGMHTQLTVDQNWDVTSHVMNKLRKETIWWLFSDVNVPGHPHGNYDKWERNSYNLFTRAKAPELKQTKKAVNHAFFEKPNSVLPRYY